jgi:hypothetical protein
VLEFKASLLRFNMRRSQKAGLTCDATNVEFNADKNKSHCVDVVEKMVLEFKASLIAARQT